MFMEAAENFYKKGTHRGGKALLAPSEIETSLHHGLIQSWHHLGRKPHSVFQTTCLAKYTSWEFGWGCSGIFIERCGQWEHEHSP